MNEKAKTLWNKYKQQEARKETLNTIRKEIEAELDYCGALSALYLEEYDKEIMKND